MKLIALRQALDGRDLASFHESGEREARLHALAVHQHRAGAALTEAAAFLRAGQMQVLAKCVEQGRARIELEAMRRSVDAQHEVERGRRGAGGLCGGQRDGPRHELSSYKSGTGYRGDLHKFSSGHVGAGDPPASRAGWHFHAALPSERTQGVPSI